MTVTDLLKQGSFKTVCEVAQGSFEFLNRQCAYHHLENTPHFFKLSGVLADREISFKNRTPEPELYQSMLKLSQTIICEVFKVFKESNIDIIRLKLEDLDNIVALLGSQQNYAHLEVLYHFPNDHLDANPPL